MDSESPILSEFGLPVKEGQVGKGNIIGHGKTGLRCTLVRSKGDVCRGVNCTALYQLHKGTSSSGEVTLLSFGCPRRLSWYC